MWCVKGTSFGYLRFLLSIFRQVPYPTRAIEDLKLQHQTRDAAIGLTRPQMRSTVYAPDVRGKSLHAISFLLNHVVDNHISVTPSGTVKRLPIKALQGVVDHRRTIGIINDRSPRRLDVN
jgi:hypothetical protein